MVTVTSRAVVLSVLFSSLGAQAAPAPLAVTLPSGASFKLPAGVRAIESDKATDKRYVLGGSTMIHVAETTEADCAAFLGKTYSGTNAARTDPAQAAINHIEKLEWRTVAGHKVVYAEVATRTPDEVKANKEPHAIVLAALCHDNVSFGVDVSQRQGKLTPASIKLLDGVLESLVTPPVKPEPAAPAATTAPAAPTAPTAPAAPAPR
jgi:hypothetical protein